MENLHYIISDAMAQLLNTIGDLVVGSDLNESDSFGSSKGRDTSTRFEKDIVIPVMEENNDTIISSFNLSFTDASLTSLVIPDGDDESTKRSIADFFAVFNVVTENSALEVKIPVNIKYTSGKTKDNVMGLQGFMAFLTGEESGKTGLINLLEDNTVSTAPYSDYYIFSFKHGEDKPTEDFDYASLLNSDPDSKGFLYNSAQSFPLQARIDQVEGFSSSFTVAERRQAWVDWIISGRKREMEKLQAEISALQHFSDN